MGDNRGGPRQGSVGQRYQNRSDMRTPGQRITPSNLPASQQYGQGVQQARSLSVAPTPGATVPQGSSPNSAPQTVLQPGDVPSLSDPTANPNEPVTAGLSLGPGVGPEGLGAIAVQDSPELGIAKRLFLEFPNPDLRRYISYLEDTLQF